MRKSSIINCIVVLSLLLDASCSAHASENDHHHNNLRQPRDSTNDAAEKNKSDYKPNAIKGAEKNQQKEDRELIDIEDVPDRKIPPTVSKDDYKFPYRSRFKDLKDQYVPSESPSSSPTPRPTPPPTPAPTLTPLELVPKRVGVFYLQKCQGDCNFDTDCAFGLVCMQRAATTSVPGCSGNPNLLGKGDEDYCIAPPTANRLVIMGDDVYGELSAFPLGRCQGDCNTDNDCRGNLLCRQRDDNSAITGCSGRGAPGFDYCFQPGPNDLVYLGDDDEGFRGQGPPNLAKCRGDCDEDTDCQDGLVCFQRDFGARTVPGCIGNAFYIGNGDDDFCIQASSNTLNYRGDNGQPAGAFPLGNCQADCDNDSDCAGNLRCFDRNAFESVPGCVGDGVSGYDYCAFF